MTKDMKSLELITRRGLIKGAGAAGLVITGLGSQGAAATPKRGGLLRVGFPQGSTTDNLDPQTYFNGHMYSVGWLLGNNLVELDSQKKPIPELAESWESQNKATRWIFKLRSGVEFSNGKTLKPSDVIYSLKRHIAENSKSGAKGLLQGITDIKADGSHNVVIEHATGDADIPALMTDFHLQIVPEDFNDWNGFIGTGPYVLEKFDPGVRLNARRNKNYWKADRAWFDEVEFLFLPDPTARLSSLMSGETHAIGNVDSKTVSLVEKTSTIKLVEASGVDYTTTAMNSKEGVFANPHVREAMKFAINRQEIVDKVFSGYGEVGNDHPIPSNDPYFNSELPQRAYDPDKALWNLKQAGLSSLDVEISAADAAFTGAVDAALLMQESGRAAGINLSVQREPNDAYWDNVWMKKPFVMSNWTVRPTPGLMFAAAFKCGAPWNETFWCNDEFEKLLEAGKTETDFNKRRDIYWEAQAICHKDGGNGLFAFPSTIDGYDKRVGGVGPDAVRQLGGCRLAERAWFET